MSFKYDTLIMCPHDLTEKEIRHLKVEVCRHLGVPIENYEYSTNYKKIGRDFKIKTDEQSQYKRIVLASLVSDRYMPAIHHLVVAGSRELGIIIARQIGPDFQDIAVDIEVGRVFTEIGT